VLQKSNPRPAAFFGGTQAAVNWFNDAYYDLVDYYLARGAFVGREERNFHALAYLAPRRFTAIPGWYHEYTPSPGRIWQIHMYFYRNFLARREEMWKMLRFIPRPTLFVDVPYDQSCMADRAVFSILKEGFNSIFVQLENWCSEAIYHVRKFLRNWMVLRISRSII
jgi:hypothetical protein